jgi:hypothetical protein
LAVVETYFSPTEQVRKSNSRDPKRNRNRNMQIIAFSNFAADGAQASDAFASIVVAFALRFCGVSF